MKSVDWWRGALTRRWRNGHERKKHHHVPQDKLQLGARAEALRHDEVLQLAFGLVEHDIEKQWKQSAPISKGTREEAYRMHWALETLKAKLDKMLGDAKMIRAEYERKEKERLAEIARRERGL